MLTILWNLCIFHSISVSTKGANSMPCIMSPRCSRRYTNRMHLMPQKAGLNLIVHADNTQPHTARLSVDFGEDNRMKTAPQHPHSSDIAPSDFYHFGYVKRCLARRSFMDAEELLKQFDDFLTALTKLLCKQCFSSEWTGRGNASILIASTPNKLKNSYRLDFYTHNSEILTSWRAPSTCQCLILCSKANALASCLTFVSWLGF
jgi:hypothetical protein